MTTPPPVPPTPPTGSGQPPYQPGHRYPQQPPPAPQQPGFPPQGPPPQGRGPQHGYPQGGYQQPGYAPSYAPPGQFARPAAPSFATPPPAGQHRLSGKIIAAIVAGVVIVAGGIGAALALSGGSSSKKPVPVAASSHPAPAPAPTTQPAPGPSTQPAPATSAAPTSAPSTEAAPSTQPAPAPTSKAAPNPTTAAITIAGPVTVSPAAGWQVVKRGSGYVILAGNGAQLYVYAYRAQSSDVTQDLVQSIEAFTKGTTGLQLGKAAPAARINGRNFDELRDVPFVFNVSTQQGTATVHGLFVQFLNSHNGVAAFCVYASTSPSALQANAKAGLAMIASVE